MSGGKSWKGWLAFAAGLALGLAVLVGYILGTSQQQPTVQAPNLQLKAMSGYGAETFAMVTGPIDTDDGSEGVFLLDYSTGDLTCWVINPRTGTFGAGFKRNVVNDLKVEKGKKPSFVMATGVVSWKGFTGLQRPASAVVYVCDANTGRFGAYMVPWTPGAFALGALQINEMKLLAAGEARGVEVRK
jgi:hypothetical protein